MNSTKNTENRLVAYLLVMPMWHRVPFWLILGANIDLLLNNFDIYGRFETAILVGLAVGAFEQIFNYWKIKKTP